MVEKVRVWICFFGKTKPNALEKLGHKWLKHRKSAGKQLKNPAASKTNSIIMSLIWSSATESKRVRKAIEWLSNSIQSTEVKRIFVGSIRQTITTVAARRKQLIGQWWLQQKRLQLDGAETHLQPVSVCRRTNRSNSNKPEEHVDVHRVNGRP